MSRPHRVTASAPAKVNLYLGVGPRRGDGFHPLATLYHAIGLRDVVTASRPRSGGRRGTEPVVSVDGDQSLLLTDVPRGPENIAARAASLLAQQYGVDEPVLLHIDKRIPVAGGLAGGSADAAATLTACDALWGLGATQADLLDLAAELGSDVPFALLGGTAAGAGRGELVTSVPVPGDYWWVVARSREGMSTPAVYAAFDHTPQGAAAVEPTIPPAMTAALAEHDVERLGAVLNNDLQPAALGLRPDLAAVLRHGLGAGAVGALVSGSGPSCLFLGRDQEHAAHVAGRLAEDVSADVLVTSGPVPGARIESKD